jgi:hypothetical protein
MATYTGKRIVSATLTANSVDTITLDADYVSVEILNRNGGAEIYVIIDSGTTDPTVGGANCDVLPAAISSLIVGAPAIAPTQVKLISSAATAYTVKGLQ